MNVIAKTLRIRLLGLAVLMVPSLLAQAVVVDTLYTVNVPVLGQSSAERGEAFRLAMQAVLVRIAGNREIAAVPEVEDLVRQVSRYVQQYVYMGLDKATPAEVLDFLASEPDQKSEAIAAPSVPTQFLRIEFDGRAIEKRLNEKNMPVWGQNRPATLVWLAVQEGNRSIILGESDTHQMKTIIEKAAVQRGIPLIFPLQDLEDRENLRVADIRLGFTDSIQKASKRYSAEIILVGMLTQRGQDQWSADWTVYRQNTSTRWQLESIASEVAYSGIDNTADILASRYAFSGTRDVQRMTVSVQVENIKSINDYASVQKYLESLTPVDAVNPRLVKEGAVYYDVTMRGGRAELERAIALQTLLKSVVASPVFNGSNTSIALAQLPLRYQLSSPKREQ